MARQFSGCKPRGQGRHQLSPTTCPSSIMSRHLCWVRSCPEPSFIHSAQGGKAGWPAPSPHDENSFFLLSASCPRTSNSKFITKSNRYPLPFSITSHLGFQTASFCTSLPLTFTHSRSSRAAVLNLWVSTPVGIVYQRFTLQFITVTKLQLGSGNTVISWGGHHT